MSSWGPLYDPRVGCAGLFVEVVKAVRCPAPPALVRGVLAACLEEPEVAGRMAALGGDAAVTVRLTGDRELRRLNRDFLGLDHPTDVLAFPAGGEAGGYLGDIAVSWPAVMRQAERYGQASPLDELGLLCVHGFLHLLGFDHASAAEEREMWRATRSCLRRAGIGLAGGRLPARA